MLIRALTIAIALSACDSARSTPDASVDASLPDAYVYPPCEWRKCGEFPLIDFSLDGEVDGDYVRIPREQLDRVRAYVDRSLVWAQCRRYHDAYATCE